MVTHSVLRARDRAMASDEGPLDAADRIAMYDRCAKAIRSVGEVRLDLWHVYNVAQGWYSRSRSSAVNWGHSKRRP